MMRKHVLLLICLLLLLTATGCWSRKELNELAIVLAMGIDKAGEELRVSIQVVEPEQVSSQKGGGGARSAITTYNIVAPTITEALRKITIEMPRKPFLAHLRVLVISEDLAKEGINKILDGISRDNQFRTDFYIIVTKGSSAIDVLSINTELEKLPANTLHDALRTSEAEWAPTKSVTLDKLINNLIATGKQPVITGIKLVGEVDIGKTRENVDQVKADSYLIYEELAIFRNDKLIGWFDVAESKGYNYIMGNLKRTAGRLACPSGKGTVVAEIRRIKTKTNVSFKHKKPHVAVHVRGEANIAEVDCDINLNDPQSIHKIEHRMNEVIEKLMKLSVTSAQKKYNADVFGFGQAINRADKDAWKALYDDWNEQFAKLPVTVNSEVKIRNLGTLHNSYIQEIHPIDQEN